MSFVSYAQNYEDVMLFRALRGIEHGFYIDVGAQDPVDDSVTKAFYEKGWRGINIEPVTHWFQRLVTDRPHDINLQVAVSDSPGKLHLFEVMDSGLSTTDPDFAKRHAQAGYQIRESDVDCLTLDNICKSQQVGEVHFLKIDCEGSEAAALRGLSLERIRPWVILLEATAPNSQQPVYMEWEPLLTGGGYHFVYEDGLNRFYVADEHGELDQVFSHPPNVFDYFVRASEAVARNDLQAAQGDLSALRDAQRVARVESECEQLRASAEYFRSENERRVAALTEHRQLLGEAAEREAQGVARLQAEHERSEGALAQYRRLVEEATEREAQSLERMQAEREQWRIDLEYFHSENERREAALVEHRRLLAEAAEREAPGVARLQAEHERSEAALAQYRRLLEEAAEREAQSLERMQTEREQWRIDLEYLRNENERREAALAEHRRMLGEAAEREAQGVARLQAEHERSEAALAQYRRLLDEAAERDAQCMTCVQAEREQWRTDLEYLRNENGRREAALVEHRRLLGEAAEHEVRLVGEIEGLRINMESQRSQNVRMTQHLIEKNQQIAAMEAELSKSREELSKIKGLEAALARQDDQLSLNLAEIEDLRQARATLAEALETSLREMSRTDSGAAAFRQQAANTMNDLELIFSSRSWKITRPLRLIAGLWYSWRRGHDGDHGAASDIESKYRLLAAEVVSASGSRPSLGDPSQKGLPEVEAILVGKDVEALTDLRSRIRHRNSVK